MVRRAGRRPIYQLTELGFLAHGAVERVVSAHPDDAQHRAVALGPILEDLPALADANLMVVDLDASSTSCEGVRR